MEVVGQSHSPAALTPGKRAGTHCIRVWVGPMTAWTGAKNFDPPPPGPSGP
jgi:hypothetical protein